LLGRLLRLGFSVRWSCHLLFPHGTRQQACHLVDRLRACLKGHGLGSLARQRNLCSRGYCDRWCGTRRCHGSAPGRVDPRGEQAPAADQGEDHNPKRPSARAGRSVPLVEGGPVLDELLLRRRGESCRFLLGRVVGLLCLR
jgi:hypothetical protein